MECPDICNLKSSFERLVPSQFPCNLVRFLGLTLLVAVVRSYFLCWKTYRFCTFHDETYHFRFNLLESRTRSSWNVRRDMLFQEDFHIILQKNKILEIDPPFLPNCRLFYVPFNDVINDAICWKFLRDYPDMDDRYTKHYYILPINCKSYMGFCISIFAFCHDQF